jgi:hypothetical protein
MAKKNEIACARSSSGKISLIVRYAAEAPAEAKKKMTHHQAVWLVAFSRLAENNDAPIIMRAPETQ